MLDGRRGDLARGTAALPNDLEKIAMSFGNPYWLWALLALPGLIFFFARAEQLGSERLRQFVAARLLPRLAGTVNRGRRVFRFVLLLFVLALVIVSLARPRWGYSYDEVKRKGLDLLL